MQQIPLLFEPREHDKPEKRGLTCTILGTETRGRRHVDAHHRPGPGGYFVLDTRGEIHDRDRVEQTWYRGELAIWTRPSSLW